MLETVVTLTIMAAVAYYLFVVRANQPADMDEFEGQDLTFPDEEIIQDMITAEFLNSMSKTQLMNWCEERGIRIAKSWTKARIVEAILEGDMT